MTCPSVEQDVRLNITLMPFWGSSNMLGNTYIKLYDLARMFKVDQSVSPRWTSPLARSTFGRGRPPRTNYQEKNSSGSPTEQKKYI